MFADLLKKMYAFEPNKAVCVYHYIDDIWKIPEYKFVFRGGAHLVCYAKTEKFK